jgi:2-polyprenyl-6-methoxyphenol hydroxylase-like FAD-dependent oxidoreductase
VPQPHALVIGGSVGGLFAAGLLRAAGWTVSVFERASGDLGDRGTGIGTRDELFAVMRRMGIEVDASIGVEVKGRIALGAHRKLVHDASVGAVTSAWSRIWRPLRAALPEANYRAGASLIRIAQDSDRVVATFDDGTRAEGELLVAADGLHSTVRGQLLPDLRPRYAGYVAWRGVVDEHQVEPALRELLFDRMAFGFPEGELLSIPMPGPSVGPPRGERRCHFVWFRPVAEETLPELCTDASGRRYGVSIPPPLIRRELIERLRHDADKSLAPQLAGLVKATSQIILQPIFDLESPAVAFGRAALVGDAAFVARPHVATGVMKAAVDAECLASALEAAGADVAAALTRYDAERRPYGRWLVARGRHIGAYFEARGGDAMERIQAIMREYGAAGLVGNQPIAAHIPE